MKRSDAAPAPGTRYKRRKKLVAFGEFMKEAREAHIPSQQKAVDVLASCGLEVSQSWVAQLETGRITDPDPEILRKIETAYRIDYDRLVFALIQDKYRLDDRSFLSPISRQRWKTFHALLPRVPVVGTVEGLEEDQLRAKEAVLSAEVLDSTGLARWQATFPNLAELWIIASTFRDDKETHLRAAALENLKRGVRLLYFLRKVDLEEGKPFWLFLRRLSAEFRKPLEPHVRAVPLEEAERRWITSDLVIANPTDPLTRVGFVALRHDQVARFAFRMSEWDLETTVESVLPLVVKKLGKERL